MVNDNAHHNFGMDKNLDEERAEEADIASPGTLYGEPSGFTLVCPESGCRRIAVVLDIDELVQCPVHKKKMLPET